MRISLDFEMENEYLIQDYHRVFLSFLKKSISEYQNGSYYDNYYNENPKLNSKKDFSWSVGLSNPVFEKDYIEVLGKKINMIFVTQEMTNKLVFYEAFNNQKGKSFKISEKNSIVLKSVKIQNEREISGNVASFKILSPLLIRLHNHDKNFDRYVSVEDEDFDFEFKRQLKRNYPSLEEYIDDMKMDISGMKKIVVKIFGQKVNAAIGNLFVMGDNKILKAMYLNSIGSRKSAGFGVLGVNDCWEVS